MAFNLSLTTENALSFNDQALFMPYSFVPLINHSMPFESKERDALDYLFAMKLK